MQGQGAAHLYRGACQQHCLWVVCGQQLGEGPGGGGRQRGGTNVCLPRHHGHPALRVQGGTPKREGGSQESGQPLTMPGPLEDEALRGLRVRLTLLPLPKVWGGWFKGCLGWGSGCPGEGGNPGVLPAPPRCLPWGQGLGALISFTARAHCRAPAPEAFGCQEKWGE